MTAFDVAILGAGPAGLSAARAAARSGKSVVLLDDNPAAGGQIWRGNARIAVPSEVRFLSATRVFDLRPGFEIACLPHGTIRAHKLILATGARELFLPFPGWTQPGVLGAGALQALAKSGLPVKGARVLVAGSGPLLLAVAAALRARGARIVGIAEQSPFSRILPLFQRHPSKLPEALALRARLLGVRYWTGVWPVRHEDGQTQLSNGKRISSDYLACGFGLLPNTEAAQLLGCRMDDGFVAVDSRQQTSVEGVYCAGEPTGIGGLKKALEEGERAGAAATGQPVAIRRSHTGGFVRDLAAAFAIRPQLYDLAGPDTILCRCEDVPYSAMAPMREWRNAKLQTRCGMGPCQGRICGPIGAHLFGWKPDGVRPPLFPVPAEALARVETPPGPENDRLDTGHSSNR
ncbi:MAG TPA: FAD-dependent oxidoreductase [Bryobacteraceae bacterium]|nr:FAD-dependent oxidoreductase [Bryobacteraceae bacterium]